MTEQKLTDLSYLHEISMGDDRLVKEMIVLFLENTPNAIENLKTLTRQEDWSGVAAISHKLKPNLAYMGLDSAREMLQRLEENAKARKDLDNIGDLIIRIEHVCKQSYKELNKTLRKLHN